MVDNENRENDSNGSGRLEETAQGSGRKGRQEFLQYGDFLVNQRDEETGSLHPVKFGLPTLQRVSAF